MPYYAVVFTQAFPPGEHWNPKAPADDSDRRQDWPVGALYSTGTILPDTLPPHLEAIALDGPPPENTVWDIAQRAFVSAPFDVVTAESKLTVLKAEVAELEGQINAEKARRG